jgi:putative cardiolipin synthase
MRRFWIGVAVVAALTLGGCVKSSLRPDFERVPSESIAVADGIATPIGRELAPILANHPGQSGFLMLDGNVEALLARVMLADRAQRSIDLQYYIYHGDPTGRLLTQRLVAAADRGVRVRALLDDMYVLGHDASVAAVDAHPLIEVRVFNPFLSRGTSMGRQFVRDSGRLNRRMHNKAFIVDGQVAVVGGRNIGDEYFGAKEEFNFRDLDLAAIGPVVPETASNFDRYWNSAQSYPVAAFEGVAVGPAELDAARERLQSDVRQFKETDYARTALKMDFIGKVRDSTLTLYWGAAVLESDLPEKGDPAMADSTEVRITPRLRTLVEAARKQVVLISPYFVPGPNFTDFLVSLEARGVEVLLLTNSLAANDVAAVHSGYAKYRKRLLAGGVEIHELRPAPGGPVGSGPGSGGGNSLKGGSSGSGGSSSGASLHAKAFVVDAEVVFVGSFNMDPRSAQLNTEMGVVVQSPELSGAVLDYYRRGVAPESSYRVTLDGKGKLRWETMVDGKPVTYDKEPDASFWRRTQASLLRVLPIESQL